uniref:Uncharacterized protein n=1 Tax=Oryza meridionalis TaxID=40149 RepID=A0A0E0EBB9_9ORYZ
MVREAMESAEIRASAQALARQLRRDIADDGGSSAAEFQRLVGFIKELSQSMADRRGGLRPRLSVFLLSDVLQ